MVRLKFIATNKNAIERRQLYHKINAKFKNVKTFKKPEIISGF